MKKIKTGLIVVVVIILAGIVAFFYFTRPVSAPTQSLESVSEPISSQNATGTVYHISEDSSKVNFTISEVLHGSPFMPVGTTSQIAGDIAISSATSGVPQVQIGVLKIDATSFHTDSRERDGAIDRLILKSNQPANQFIVFAPDPIGAITESATNTLDFTATGNLTISGVTKQVSFGVNLTINGDGTISGTARTTLSRSDFGLQIPNIPFVADVSDTFSVVADFVAKSN